MIRNLVVHIAAFMTFDLCPFSMKVPFSSVVLCFSPIRSFVIMAWRSHGSSNNDLVTKLKENGIIETPRVEAAMRAVNRQNYCPYNSFMDSPQSIGYNATISAPHMHAHALELLREQLYEGASALDVGSGSGYLTACMAHMVGESGCAVGIEHIQELNDLALKNVEKDCPDLLKSERAVFVVGDGRLGYPSKAPYDAIHVGAAAPVVPEALHEQLKPGGRLIIPVGRQGSTQYLEQHDKQKDGTIVIKRLMGVLYVPLTSKEEQLR